ALRLRHKGGGRPLDAFLLGGELWPDLSGAAPARGGRPRRGRGRPERGPRPPGLRAHGLRPEGARRMAARHERDDRVPRRVPPAPEEEELTAPTFLGVFRAGAPGFLREGFLPLGAFYAAFQVGDLTTAIVASAAVSLLIYIYERRAGREGLLVRLSLLTAGAAV